MVIRDPYDNCKTNARLDGKVAVVTGATSGIGLEVAKDLAKRGAKVIIASRSPDKLENAKNTIIKHAGHDNVVARQMDFESLASVRYFAREMIDTEPKLDILVNNIGAVGLQDKYSADGLQLMMQVNYFGTFLLTFLLFPLLKNSTPSRIVNVASFMSFLGQVDIEHLNDVGQYSNIGYYCNAKRADILFTIEMDKRIKGSGVTVNSLDPGLIKSEFFRNWDDEFLKTLLNSILLAFGEPPKVAAQTPIFLAADPKVQNASGKNFRQCIEHFTFWFAKDPALSRRLWDVSKKLVDIMPSEDWENL